MFFKKYTIPLLLLITLLGGFLRLYKLGSVPSTLNPDEASIAYNALLLSEVGKDEWGRTWPLILEAFGDQKPIGYPSLVVLFFKIFGYHDWVVKLPSTLAGIAIIPLTYLLAGRFKMNKLFAILTTVIISALPIFIFYSHIAFEAMVGLLLTVIVIVLTYQHHKKYQLVFDILAVVCSLFAFFTYNSPFIILPLLLIPVPLIRGVKTWKSWLPLIICFSAAWIFAYSTLFSFNQQKSQITIFSEAVYMAEYVPYREQFSGIAQKIIGNKYVFYVSEIFENILSSFSADYLISNKGGHPWHAVPGTGYLYNSVYVFGIYGIVATIITLFTSLINSRKRISQYTLGHSHLLLLIWLLIVSLLPAGITVNAPHATRTLLYFIVFAIFAGRGYEYLSTVISKYFPANKIKTSIVLSALLIGVLTFETLKYSDTLFNDYANDLTKQAVFMPGFESVINEVEREYVDQPVAIVDGRGFQYISTAWYLKMTPDEYFATVIKQQPDRINFRYGQQVGNYHFIANPEDRTEEKVLVFWDGETWQINTFD